MFNPICLKEKSPHTLSAAVCSCSFSKEKNGKGHPKHLHPQRFHLCQMTPWQAPPKGQIWKAEQKRQSCRLLKIDDLSKGGTVRKLLGRKIHLKGRRGDSLAG